MIIEGMLFNPYDIEGITRARALSLFELVEPDPVDNVDGDFPESSALIA